MASEDEFAAGQPIKIGKNASYIAIMP